jgi:hypothetical protein
MGLKQTPACKFILVNDIAPVKVENNSRNIGEKMTISFLTSVHVDLITL